MLPDYAGGSLVNLMQSIRAGFGIADDGVPALRILPPDEIAAAKNVLFILIDGLGYGYYGRHGTLLTGHLRGSMTSVFPSATASAVTTIHTGRPPSRHAIVGWNMYLDELGGVTTFLPFRARGAKTGLGGAGVPLASLVGAAPLADSLPLGVVHVIPKQLVTSAYSIAMAGRGERIGGGTLGQWTKRTIEVVKTATDRRYVYAYWPELDALSHAHGTESAAARRHLLELERAVERISSALKGTDTLMIVTADHGFIDVDPAAVHRLEDHPQLAECLSQPLCGESRTAYCHVRPERADAFVTYVRERLGYAFELYPSAELVEGGWFGPGLADPRLSGRVGDWVMVGRDRHLIRDIVPGEPPWKHLGVHGGVSEDEMLVPLFVMQC